MYAFQQRSWKGSGNGHWFDAKRVGQRYHSTDLGTMNDRTESLYVAPGYKCTVWADNFEGKSLTFYPGWHLYHELKYEGMVDKISSVQADKAPSATKNSPRTRSLWPGNTTRVIRGKRKYTIPWASHWVYRTLAVRTRSPAFG